MPFLLIHTKVPFDKGTFLNLQEVFMTYEKKLIADN